MNKIDCDILVVGAGISGLVAAREISNLSKDLKVLVVEAKSRVGGRTLSVDLKVHNKNGPAFAKFDIGGQWVGLTQTRILDLIKELGLEIYPQYAEGKKLAQIGKTKIRSYSSSLPSTKELRQYSVFEMINFVKNFPKLERLVESVNLKDLYSTPDAKYLDTISVEEWARRNSILSRFMLDVVEISTRSVLGIPAKRISMLYYLYYAKSAGKLVDLFECTGNGAQGWKVKGGTQQISEILADRFGRDKIFLNHAVTEINTLLTTEPQKVKVQCIDSNGESRIVEFECKRLILAMSPTECGHIRFQPSLSYEKKQLFDRAPQGNLLKFVVTYKSPFWREKKLSGEILSTGWTENKYEIRPLLCVYDATTANDEAALVGFIHNDVWSNVPFEKRRDAVLEDLTRFLGPEALDYVDYIDKDWHREPYTGGCPVSIVPPGNMQAWLANRQTYPLSDCPGSGIVHFAGTETATLWIGYMSGAAQAGLRTAHEVLYWLDRSKCDMKHLKTSPGYGQCDVPLGPDYSY